MNENLKGKLTCTGCAACLYACQHNAISMVESNEGFVYPIINKDICVQCGACSNICNKKVNREVITVDNAKAFQATDTVLLFNSSSGGIIPSIAKVILEQGGVYIAAKYYPIVGKAYWDVITKAEDIKNASGSKYFQIPLTEEILKTLIAELREKKVLFAGTPCQVAAVKKIVPASLQDGLLTIDLICGGVQSYKLEKSYIKHLSNVAGNQVISHKFRAKDKGWNKKYLSIVEYSDGTGQLRMGSKDMFQRTFSSGCYLRESCYTCEYVGRERVGDITVGDCWGVEKQANTSFEKKKGISLVGFNSNKGTEAFDLIKDKGTFESITDDILAENKPLNKNTPKPRLRSISYDMLDKFPFVVAINVICYKYLIKKLIGRG